MGNHNKVLGSRTKKIKSTLTKKSQQEFDFFSEEKRVFWLFKNCCRTLWINPDYKIKITRYRCRSCKIPARKNWILQDLARVFCKFSNKLSRSYRNFSLVYEEFFIMLPSSWMIKIQNQWWSQLILFRSIFLLFIELLLIIF